MKNIEISRVNTRRASVLCLTQLEKVHKNVDYGKFIKMRKWLRKINVSIGEIQKSKRQMTKKYQIDSRFLTRSPYLQHKCKFCFKYRKKVSERYKKQRYDNLSLV